MKRAIVITVPFIAFLLVLCLLLYWIYPHIQVIGWAVTSIVEVPVCTARVADKLGIPRDFSAVKEYILESLEPGMTPAEVKKTLSQFGPVDMGETFNGEEQDSEVLVRLCPNPVGNVALLLYYSKDGHLISAEDAYDQ